ncbi:MAG: hypothetical protein LC791_07925 [Acidobacteria bacterium]|nr:hypothetical protein [Acidobacteriota bacterium]
MRHWRVFLIVIGCAAGGFAAGAQSGLELKGQVTASDTEAAEGYFAIDEDTTLAVRPGSAIHRWLLERAGQQVTLLVETK